MSRPTPGTEGYWTQIDQWTPQAGDLARLVAHESAPAVYVLEADHSEGIVDALLLADLERERVDMLLEAEARERKSLVAPIRKSHETEDTVELTIPTDHLEPIGELVAEPGGESA
ncbi:hypothetical protein [Halosimplex pelagicum]|uniref:Uncharacterized protein n=1 Tax=Halosimplex pelagicum TaxID=869886 RepID=A0A7D5SWW6_9EURY|nr:hypothetical protein [Halosimplex pelagicum]QLH83387.1 hypothetical protein HZS54_17890 [Halosimplex pelagicum]